METEKQSYISASQLLGLMIMARLPFSTIYYVSLKADASIQDILLAVPINFILNFVVAIPILVLLKRHPGKDLIEIARNSMGRFSGAVIAIFYILYLLAALIYDQSAMSDGFGNAIIPESGVVTIAVPIMIAAIYGAVKGIESIARFGGIVITFYLLALLIIFLSLLPISNFNYLMPVLYNGPDVLVKAIINGFNSNMQILLLAFCAPFLRTGIRFGKIYTKWNIIAMAVFFLLELDTIVVLGPFASLQTYPLFTLSVNSSVSVFQRLEVFYNISWVLNTSLISMIFLYIAYSCLTKIGMRKFRKTATILLAAAAFTVICIISKRFTVIHGVTISPLCTAVTFIAVIILPLAILIADLIKGGPEPIEKAC